MLLGLIELGSSTALNAIIGGLIVCLYSSYSIPIACLLMNRRAAFPQKRYFDLGKLGVALNIIALLWVAIMVVWLCLPLYLPVTGTGMNYTSAVIAAVVLVSAINWPFAGKTFKAPTSMYTDGHALDQVIQGVETLA